MFEYNYLLVFENYMCHMRGYNKAVLPTKLFNSRNLESVYFINDDVTATARWPIVIDEIHN